MTMIALANEGTQSGFGLGFLGRLFRASAQPRTEAPADDTRDRQAFVTEMLNRDSCAFEGEADLRAMMTMFPDRF